ncbi:hypothetical protein [Oceanimonas doudoroffii]|uniref:hypothetical protein n=1 Tax=Oceanimonas doudoroffii TaxID=84158 RepID=UPI0011401428|nr:hypothetical protein [Oceanimonas doudoroffii]
MKLLIIFRWERQADSHERSFQLFTPSSKAVRVPQIDPDQNRQTNTAPPTENGKLDFTKKWLEDDLHSLATDPDPKPDLLQFGPAEADLHSVGSASAEIAAITGKEILAALKIPDLVPQKHQAVIKPSPVRYASFQDVSVPFPPPRKDSLSSVDSARVKVGKFIERHACADERLLDVKANLGHVKRKADFFGRLSDNDSDRGRRSPSADKKPPHSAYFQLKQQSVGTPQKQPEAFNMSDEDGGLQQKHSYRYAESTRSLPIIRGNSYPEWRKQKQANIEPTPQKPGRVLEAPQTGEQSMNYSSSNTLTEAEPSRNQKKPEHNQRFLRNKRNLGSEALQTVDHLVAELELNTEEQELSSRAFPTAGIAKYGVDFSALPEDVPEPQSAKTFVPEQPITSTVPEKKPEPKTPKRVNLYEDFNEAQKVLLDSTLSNFGQSQYERGNLGQTQSHNSDIFRPQFKAEEYSRGGDQFNDVKNGFRNTFMTINQEKLGESKVVSMKTMFEPMQENEKSPPKLPVVTSQPPGKGTIPAPIPFRPTESRIPAGPSMETSLTGNYDLYQAPSEKGRSQQLRRHSSRRAFQQIHSSNLSDMLPIRAIVPVVPSTAPPPKPQDFAESKSSKQKAHDADDDYDNVIVPEGKAAGRNPGISLRHPSAIKINSMKLGGDDEQLPAPIEASSKNPIKNLLRRLKSQPPKSSDTAPRQPSTLSLNEPGSGPPMLTMYSLHKSSSVGEAWSESSSLSHYSEDRLPPPTGI